MGVTSKTVEPIKMGGTSWKEPPTVFFILLWMPPFFDAVSG